MRSHGRTRRPRAGITGIVIVLLVLGVHSSQVAAQEKAGRPSPEDAVRAAETARGEALMKADTTALSRLVGDEFIEVSRLGLLRTKADNLRDIASGALQLATVKYDSVSVRVYGDVAILRAIADNTGTFRGFPFSGKIWYTRVFVRRDGRWQAVAMQQTSLP